MPGTASNSATTGHAGIFDGDVEVNGNLSKTSGSFKIDHPLDPANNYLYHSFVESPDMTNIYDGTVRLDSNGEAVVQLPAWFGAQPRLSISPHTRRRTRPRPIYSRGNRRHHFKIAGGSPGMKVSWQVTGLRQDAWANAHGIPVEETKSGPEQGHYLHPELFDQPEEKSVEWARNPEMMKKLKEKREQQIKQAQSSGSAAASAPRPANSNASTKAAAGNE